MRRKWLLAVPAILLCACCGSSSPTTPTPPPPAAPTIQALLIAVPESLEMGQIVQLRAETLLSDGTWKPVAASGVSWHVSNPVVATVSTTGEFSALQAGIVDVHATYQQWTSGTRSVTVTAPGGWWDY